MIGYINNFNTFFNASRPISRYHFSNTTRSRLYVLCKMDLVSQKIREQFIPTLFLNVIGLVVSVPLFGGQLSSFFSYLSSIVFYSDNLRFSVTRQVPANRDCTNLCDRIGMMVPIYMVAIISILISTPIFNKHRRRVYVICITSWSNHSCLLHLKIVETISTFHEKKLSFQHRQ